MTISVQDSGVTQSLRSPVLDVAAQIVGAIREGQLAPGQRLIEAEFAKRLGVARSTVREAFQRLEVEGLLCVERHRGFLVRTLSRDRIRKMYEVREVLDGLAARLSAPAFKESGQDLRDVAQRLQAAREQMSLSDFTRCNREFHELIRVRSGNDMISKILNTLEHSVYHYQYRLLVQGRAVFDSQDDHAKIAAALLGGDGEEAERLTIKHVRQSFEQLMLLPDSLFG